MNILVTGANGFVGRNLVENLKNVRDGKNRTRLECAITEIYEYDKDCDIAELEYACKRADFVFHFAGVNRPKELSGFMEGNYESAYGLLDALKKYHNVCPIVLSSSLQASLAGRFEGSEYGKSKLAVEELFFQYSKETGAKVMVYRFPNIFGKWCKPDYNSAVATFCNAVANDLAYHVNDPSIELELLYIDDLIAEMFGALAGEEHRCEYPKDNVHDGLRAVGKYDGRYCYAPITHYATLGEVVDLLESFKLALKTFVMPKIQADSFEKKLYSAYLSYLPKAKMFYGFKSNIDHRGSFTELIRTANCGQISVNVAKPGVTKGQHWHNSKWEIFIVVSGHGLIRERQIGINPKTGREYPVIEFEVTGDQMKAVQMLPGYTHNITNLSKTVDLVTVIWANEPFDEKHPDTFYETVEVADFERKSDESDLTIPTPHSKIS